MEIMINTGSYYQTPLEEWARQVGQRLDFIQESVADIQQTIENIKKIVPLVDDDLGMVGPSSGEESDGN